MPSFDLERSETIITSGASPLRAVAVAVAVGVAFGAGALTGRTATAERPDEPLSLTSAEKRAEDLEARRAALKLSFASDLVKADAVTKPPMLPKATAPAAAHEPAPTPVGEPAEREPERAPDPVRAEAAPVPEDDDEPVGVVKQPKEDAARMKKALAKVLGDAPAPAERANDDEKPARRSFTLQVASTPVKENAEQLRAKLAAGGHAARVVEAELDGGKKVYRVRVGSFDTREKADALKAKIAMPTFVVSE